MGQAPGDLDRRGDDLFRESRQAQIAANLPTACLVVFVVSLVYAVSEYLFRPVQAHAAWLPDLLQILVPLAAWALVRSTPLSRRAEALALATDFAYTACLSSQLFLPLSTTSGTSLFIAVKMLATALFFPWSARVQTLSACATVALYWSFGIATSRFDDPTLRLHQILGPAIAAVLSVAGAARADRVRRELFRRDAEREELVARLQMILDRMPIGCIINDADFRFTYWNPAAEEIFGYHFEEVRGRHPFELITPPAGRADAEAAFRRLRAGEIPGSGHGPNLTKDGRLIVCDWKATPLVRRDGAFLGVLAMCQDVTARQRDEEEKAILLEELKAANRLKSDFVATMSHELRTPLNVILGYSDLLLEGAFGDVAAEQEIALRRVGRSGQELLELIDATLDVSRLEAGRVDVVIRSVHLRDLVAQIDAETREAQRKAGVRVEWLVGAELPPIRTDPVKFKVVLKNLFTNALKFTDEGSVTVSAQPRDGGVEVTVADTGVGISPDSLPIIFEAFRQVDSSATRRHGGVGLGLYIVRRLSDILGCTIAVESELGRGTVFRLWVQS